MDVITVAELAAERRHVPAARRRAGDAVHPPRRGAAAQADRPRHRRWRRSASASTRSSSSTTTRPDKLQFFADVKWIEAIHSQLHDRPRRHQPAAVRAVELHHPRGDHLHVRRHARGREPQGVPDADARAADRHGRHVHGPGPDPVLRLLRGRPAADVLHDRRVGRRAAPVRLAEVLPLHDVRLGADARGLPGPVRPDRRRELHVRLPRRAGPDDRPHRADLDLRRHVRRLRRQGADVPVPHLAARRPHPGADAGLGDPGRDPAEARHVRLRAHRHPDPARGGQGVGAGRSASSP